MNELLNNYRVIIEWIAEFRSKGEIIENSTMYFCNLRFDISDDLWSGILRPEQEDSKFRKKIFLLSLMFPENLNIVISPGTRFLVSEGSKKVIGKGEVIE